MRCGTPRRHCLRILAFRPAMPRSSSATRTSRPCKQIHTHVDEVARRGALAKLNKLLGGTE